MAADPSNLRGADPHLPTRRRYGELTQADVVDAALRFSEREGLQSLTMRKLAIELGSSSMNAYYYVASKHELFDLVCDAVLGMVPEPPANLLGWPEQLMFLFGRARDLLLRYQGVAEHLLIRAEGHPNELRLHGIVNRILLDAGFGREMLVATQRVMTYVLLGAVSQELATRAAAERSSTLTFADDDEVFRYGLGLMFDGLERRLDANRVDELWAHRMSSGQSEQAIPDDGPLHL